MTNVDNQFPSNNASANNLPQFVDRLRQLQGIIKQNTYVKDTSKHLDRIIGDANNQTMVLIVGKERVGKTTLINGLLGREILPASELNPTAVNTFLRYGEQEEIKAYFLDGVVAVFDMSVLDLLTTADTFASQILREHLDYLEVYINHDLLKSVTIIDSVALEVGGGEAAYFSESILSRVDEIFWVLRCGSIAIDAEVKLMQNLHAKGIDPLLIVNAIDAMGNDAEAFVASEKARIGHLPKDLVNVSAIKAIEAGQTNSDDLWLASNFDALIAQINRVAENSEKKTHSILIRFMQWLERFRFDLTVIPQRDPFISAVENIEKYAVDSMYEISRRQRDLAIVEEYENEYEQVSGIFDKIQTLYQLLQLISQYNFLQDDTVAAFTEKAITYQQNVRDYRKMHGEYLREYSRLDAQHNKIHGKGLMKNIFGQHAQNDFFKDRVMKLNEQQGECANQYEKMRSTEADVLNSIHTIQHHLMELAQNRLLQIENKVKELNNQRVKEQRQLNSYAAKLNEFTCLIEAQGFIRDAIEPFLMDENTPLNDKERLMVKETITAICSVDLSNNGLLARSQMKKNLSDTLIQIDFEGKYPLHALKLTDADVKSTDIPEVPNKLEIIYDEV